MSSNKPATKHTVVKPLSTMREVYDFFYTPANVVQIQVASIPEVLNR